MSDALTDKRSQSSPNDPPMSWQEAKIKVARGANTNRVTNDSIRGKVKTVDYLAHGVTTICVITMENGFKVVGHATPADPVNFKTDVGQTLAYENALRQIWPLEGYLLRENLSGGVKDAATLKASIHELLQKF